MTELRSLQRLRLLSAKGNELLGQPACMLGPQAQSICTGCNRTIQAGAMCLHCLERTRKIAAQKALIKGRLKHLHELDAFASELEGH